MEDTNRPIAALIEDKKTANITKLLVKSDVNTVVDAEPTLHYRK